MVHAIPVLQESAAEPKGEDPSLGHADEDKSWAKSWETIGLKHIWGCFNRDIHMSLS
jgi:hypothetical protein